MLLGDETTSVVHSGAGATEVDDATDDRLFDLTDGLGSTRAQAGDTGDVTGAADYDVWGAEQTNTTSSLFGWTGEQTDDETGLTYLRARYYSPTYSRFLSVDPIQPNAGGTQGFNAYAYAQNNPATLTDPSGMLPGYDELTQAGKASYHESRRIIGCWNTYQGNMAKIADCVLGPAKHFVRDHPCSAQCRNIVKWAPIVLAVAAVSIVLIACFPECMIILATPEAGAAAGSAGFLATRFPQIQAGLARLLPLVGKAPVTARAAQRVGSAPATTRTTQILANQTAGNAARDAIALMNPRSSTEVARWTGLGWRRIDVLTSELVATESKVGYTRLTPTVQLQIDKDLILLASGRVTGLQWVFTRSEVTGRSGPSPALAAKLERVGIPWFLR